MWFRKEYLHVLGAELDSYIAQVLLGMRVSGSRIILPGDLRNLVHLSEREIAGAIIRMARYRKRADEDAGRDRAAAMYLGMTTAALRHKAGIDIPVVKIDSKLRFDRRDLDRFIDRAPREGV